MKDETSPHVPKPDAMIIHPPPIMGMTNSWLNVLPLRKAKTTSCLSSHFFYVSVCLLEYPRFPYLDCDISHRCHVQSLRDLR